MIKRKKLKKGICSFLLLSLTVLCIPLQVNAASEEYDAANIDLTDCDTDFLPGTCADYELNLKNYTSMTVKGYSKVRIPTSETKDSYIRRVKNTSKDANKYAIYRNGAKSMDKDENGNFTYLDVKVYYWVKKVNSNTNLDAYYCGFTDGTNGSGKGMVAIQYDSINHPGAPNDECVRLMQEYHFYKSGTAGTEEEKEVKNVKGVSCFSDIDSQEIWEVKKKNKPVDYARSKKTEDVLCSKWNDNGKTHITKTSKDTNNDGKADVIYYSGSHYVDENGGSGVCACTQNHKVWVDWETTGRDGIIFGYRAHYRYSGVSYDAGDELRTKLSFIHKVNGDKKEEGSKTGGRITFNTERKTPVSSEVRSETVTGTLTRHLPTYVGISDFKVVNGFYKNGSSAGSSIKIKKVNKNDSLEKDYAYVYMQDKTMPSKLDANTTITFNWYSLYYINYHANGGTGSMNKQAFRYGVTQKTTENKFTKPNTLTYDYKDGRENKKVTKNSTFKEWNTKADGSGHTHKDGSKLTSHTKDSKQNAIDKIAPLATETWYAQWNNPSITFETPTRTGYSFKGWYKDAKLTKSAGTSMTLNGNHTIYAKWKDETSPNIASITATPTTWSSSDGTVTIKASDKGSGLKKVELYRKSNAETSYSLVKTFEENPATTADKTYTYTETTDGSHQYKAVAFDAAGNKKELESNVIYIDKTAPNTTKTSMKEPGERGSSVTKAYNEEERINSESYGLPVIINTTDENGSKDVSKIKYAYVKVYDTNNPSNVKYYDCGAEKRNDILKAGSDDEKIDVAEFMNGVTDDDAAKARLTELNKLSVKREFIIDITRDFKKILNLTFEIHVIDYAGNDAFTSDARLKKTHQRKAYVGGNIVRITKDNTLTAKNEFRSGYTGVVQIHTTGWVDRVDLKWTEEILQASLKDAELNQPTMHYNVLLNMDPSSSPLIDLHGLPLNEPNKVEALDTHDTTFTRNFYFRFWIPIYQEYTSEEDVYPFLTQDGKYYVDLTAERDYPFPQANDGKATATLSLKLEGGGITRRYRSVLLY